MLDIMTLMASMQLQSEMTALRKETRGEEESKPEPQEPSMLESALEAAASTPFGEAVCMVASETASALALETDEPTEKTASGWFDFPVSLDLTVPKAPERKSLHHRILNLPHRQLSSRNHLS
jgi:hypothetical protein